MKIYSMLTTLMLLAPASVWAGVPVSVPEPGVLSLLAAGGAIVVVARLLRRRK